MKLLDEYLTMNELMERWDVNKNLTIVKAVENGLRAWEICTHFPDEFILVKPDVFRERIGLSFIGSMVDYGALRISDSALPPEYVVFYMDDILKYEADNNICESTVKAAKPISANALLNEPIFQETMKALNTILLYCDENRPGKRDDGYECFCKKHKGLSKHVFEEIWKAIPEGLKRKRGQRNHG